MKSRGSQAKIEYERLVEGDRVHSSVYTDPEIFADEIDRIFHRGWVYVGHTGEIPTPGDFRLKRIGLIPIIMVRDQASEVRLLLNRCRHRGATVCQVERGNARSFRCSYHGWTYRLDGSLTGVPYPAGYGEGFERDRMGLTPVARMGIYRGFVFGNLSPTGDTLEQHLGKVREYIDLFVDRTPGSELMIDAGVQKYRYDANWKLQVENSLDGYHPPFVHQSVMAAAHDDTPDSPNSPKLIDKPDESPGPSIARTADLGGGHVTLTQMVPVSQAGNVNFLIFPNLAVVGIQLRVINPVSVDRTEVDILPTILRGAPEGVNAARLRGHEGFFGPGGMGSPDDTEVFERLQMGYTATFDPCTFIGRGRNRERHEADGVIVGDLTDEVPARGIWRHWLAVMSDGKRLTPIAGSRPIRSRRATAAR